MAISQNSINAFNHIKKNGLLSDKRLKVYHIIMSHPEGLTGAQVSKIYKANYPSSEHSESIRNRITELRDMGVLDEVGNVECEFSKRTVMKYRANTNMPTKLQPKKSLNASIDEIVDNLRTLYTKTNDSDNRSLIKLINAQLQLLKK